MRPDLSESITTIRGYSQLEIQHPHAKNSFYLAVAYGLLQHGDYKPDAKAVALFASQTFKRVDSFSLRDIGKFERRHRHHDFRLYVFSHKNNRGRDKYILYESKRPPSPRLKTIHLFLFEHEHFFFIHPPIGQFLRKSKRREIRCPNCLVRLRETNAAEHETLCFQHKQQRVIMPEDGDCLRFRAIHRLQKIPFVGYLDFESGMKQCDQRRGQNTFLLSEHIPLSYSFLVVDQENKVVFEKFGSCPAGEENVMRECLRTILGFYEKMQKELRQAKCIIFSPGEQASFRQATRCYICGGEFSPLGPKKVRDHCHFTGQYRGAACAKCNLLLYSVKTLPIFIHNLVNYDGVFLLEALKYVPHSSLISAIPKNTEKLKMINIGGIKFLDSLEFLKGSLGDIVGMARTDHLHMFEILFTLGLCRTTQERDMLLQKGVFPYDYFKSIDQMREAKNLPPREAFFNTLTGRCVSEDDYQHAMSVFSTFGCDSMYDYLKLYNRLDTALLAISFQSYRDGIFRDFHLDPAHYLSTPMLALDCFLKSTAVEIELISDPNITLLAMNNIRGGLSQINERHVKIADGEEREHLFYIDANNLYGKAMSLSLPLGGYRFLTREEIEEINWLAVDPGDPVGYAAEVDLLYPAHLHYAHRHLPVLFDNRTIQFEHLSPYSRECLSLLNRSKSYDQKKLCADFLPKNKIFVHGENLKFYLEMGLILTKVHCVVSFRQEPFIRPHIELIAEKRRAATSDFLKRFIKYLANSLYGKFLQNDRHYREVKIVRSEKKAQTYLNSKSLVAHRILSDDTVAFFLDKDKVRLNKCYLVGFSILELSKLHMLRSFYRDIVPRLGEDNVGLVLTDTDSFILHVTGMSRESMLSKLAPIMDFSNYPPGHPQFSLENKGKLGYFKDENGGCPMREVAALRSKSYITRTDAKEEARCKGVDKRAQRELHMVNYLDTLYKKEELLSNIANIQCFEGKLYTAKTRKIALCPFDDKRFIKNCGIHTTPHGSSLINAACEICP